MKEIFSLIKSNSYNEQINISWEKLQALSFDTTIIAKSGKVCINDAKKICYDSYMDIYENINKILNNIISDYNKNNDITNSIKKLQYDLQKNIVPKWRDINNHSKEYINQLFQDSVSERIYSYNAAFEVLNLVEKMAQFFCKKYKYTEDKVKNLSSIYDKCLQYENDNIFEITAGKPMVTLGYKNIANVFTIGETYGTILNYLNENNFDNELANYKNNAINLLKKTNELNIELKSIIESGKELSDSFLNQYKQILHNAISLKTIYRSAITMCGLLEYLQKTVNNLINSAYLARHDSPLQNKTHDMGCTLNPNIIQTTAIANESMTIGSEGFIKRMLNRVGTAYKDSLITEYDKFKSIEIYIDFIFEHLDEEDVINYVSKKKWNIYEFKKIKTVNDNISSFFEKQKKVIAKCKTSPTFESCWTYDISKGFDIPELKEGFKLLKSIEDEVLILAVDNYTGKTLKFNDLSEIKSNDILKYVGWTLGYVPSTLSFPTLPLYLIYKNYMSRLPIIKGKDFPINSLKDLEEIKNYSNKQGAALHSMNYYLTGKSWFNKNTRNLNNPKERDKLIVNYNRSGIYFDMLDSFYLIKAWTLYTIYEMIRDIKKYA